MPSYSALFRMIDPEAPDAAIAVPGLIALRGKVVTADALLCYHRTVAAINAQGGVWCLVLKANQDALLSDARGCFERVEDGHPTTAAVCGNLQY
ncbi:putative transposase YbfD/YdcC [Rhodobacteraceae bacterium MBR-64]